MMRESRLSQSDRSLSTFSMCAGFGGLPNRPRDSRIVAGGVSNASVVSSCGTSPILRARGAVVADDVVAVHRHRAARRIDDAADDVDQRGLAGAVRPEQGEDLAVRDVEIDVLERLEARRVGLRQVRDGDGGRS